MDATLLNLIGSIVIGILVAWAAGTVMKNVAEQGIVLDIILGVGAALFGGALLNVLAGRSAMPGLDVESLIFAFAAAVIALGVLRFLRKPLPA